MKTNFSKSVEEKVINLIIAGMDPIEAVKKALKEDIELCEEMIAQRTDRSKKAKNQICKNVYGLIHIL
jgi:DNA-directed RNA polymerase subunit L